jgi:hypothetical protein
MGRKNKRGIMMGIRLRRRDGSCRREVDIDMEEVDIMTKGKPKRDSSGRGVRANRGRGGCATTRKTGKGRNRK